jgi:hypothetical protein
LVGVFGWLDTYAPGWTYPAWYLLVLALVSLALAQPGRLRFSLAGAALGGAVLPFAATIVYALQYGPEGLVQGRYLIPILCAVPLLAAVRLGPVEARYPRVAGVGAASVFLVAAIVHAADWYWNGRRYAVGTLGPAWYAQVAQWAPPGGWTPSFALVAVAAAAIAGAGVVLLIPGRRHDAAPRDLGFGLEAAAAPD